MHFRLLIINRPACGDANFFSALTVCVNKARVVKVQDQQKKILLISKYGKESDQKFNSEVFAVPHPLNFYRIMLTT
jgi:hypothetical protein